MQYIDAVHLGKFGRLCPAVLSLILTEYVEFNTVMRTIFLTCRGFAAAMVPMRFQWLRLGVSCGDNGTWGLKQAVSRFNLSKSRVAIKSDLNTHVIRFILNALKCITSDTEGKVGPRHLNLPLETGCMTPQPILQAISELTAMEVLELGTTTHSELIDEIFSAVQQRCPRHHLCYNTSDMKSNGYPNAARSCIDRVPCFLCPKFTIRSRPEWRDWHSPYFRSLRCWVTGVSLCEGCANAFLCSGCNFVACLDAMSATDQQKHKVLQCPVSQPNNPNSPP